MAARLGTLALAALVLAACASPRSEVAEQARETLVGMPKAQLLSCAGVPHRSLIEGEVEFLTYQSGSLRATASAAPRSSIGVGVGSWGSGVGYSLGWGVPLEQVESRSCEATFRVRDGVVEAITYVTPDTGPGRFAACYAIVENCVVGLER